MSTKGIYFITGLILILGVLGLTPMNYPFRENINRISDSPDTVFTGVLPTVISATNPGGKREIGATYDSSDNLRTDDPEEAYSIFTSTRKIETCKTYSLSFSSNEGHQFYKYPENTLKIIDINTRLLETITTGYTHSVNNQKWSPDGQYLAIFDGDTSSYGHLAIIDWKSKNVVFKSNLYSYSYVWHPDSRSIWFTSVGTELSDYDYKVYKYSLETHTTEKIIDLPENSSYISWSSDGHYLAIGMPDASLQNTFPLYILNSNGDLLKTSGLEKIIAVNNNIQIAWHPFLPVLAISGGYVRESIAERFGSYLYLVSFDNYDEEDFRIENGDLPILSLSGDYSQLQWSPTGDKIIYFDWLDQTENLYLHDFRTGVTKNITPDFLEKYEKSDHTMLFSPDGKYIASLYYIFDKNYYPLMNLKTGELWIPEGKNPTGRIIIYSLETGESYVVVADNVDENSNFTWVPCDK